MPRDLQPCPRFRFTCVCSRADAPPRHRVDPFRIRGNPAAAMRRLQALLADMPRTRVVSATDGRVQAEWRSPLGFVDDIELRLGPDSMTIDVRSASRCPWCLFDLGVNRRRVEQLRRQYEAERPGQ